MLTRLDAKSCCITSGLSTDRASGRLGQTVLHRVSKARLHLATELPTRSELPAAAQLPAGTELASKALAELSADRQCHYGA